MKRSIRTTAVLLPLFFLAACNPSKTPEANAPSASPGASTATITASPNPVAVDQAPGATTVTWNTGDGSMGQVYVSKDGVEALFAEGTPGSHTAPWIEAGKTFEFRLYAGTQHATLLAKTQVTGQKSVNSPAVSP